MLFTDLVLETVEKVIERLEFLDFPWGQILVLSRIQFTSTINEAIKNIFSRYIFDVLYYII